MEHLLHVQRADEDESDETGAEQQPGRVGARERAQAEDRQRQQRRLDPGFDHSERGEQSRGCREHDNRARGTCTGSC